jgi:hypothetical protein
VEAIQASVHAHRLDELCVLLRLDGLSGTGAVLTELRGLPFVMRCKVSELLDVLGVHTRMPVPADPHFSFPESPLVRTLSDCASCPCGADGQRDRLVVATHPQGSKKQRMGTLRDGLISELLVTTLAQDVLSAADVVALSLPRGSFETARSDEDREHDPDRWCSQTAWDTKPGTCASHGDLSANLLPYARPSVPLLSQTRGKQTAEQRDGTL